ncbi:MAG: hypothetical protein K6G30_15660 [Acetatifactor sp.]|nr:hypothetical protein [Acetatifactor sp.]
MRKLKVILTAAFLLLTMLIPKVPAEAATPRVLVVSSVVNPEKPKAGEEFTITVTLKNASISTAVYSVLVTAVDENGLIVAAPGSSNQAYIRNIDKAGSATADIRLQTQEQLEIDKLPLTIEVVFNDEDGITYESSSQISVQVDANGYGIDSEVQISDSCTLAAPASVTAAVSNQLNFNVKDVTLEVEGNISEDSKSFSIGELDAKSKGFAEGYLYFTEAGTQTVNVTVSYHDAQGNYYKSSGKEFTVQVTDDGRQLINPENEEQGFHISITPDKILRIFGSLIVILIGIVCGYKIYRSKKQRGQ